MVTKRNWQSLCKRKNIEAKIVDHGSFDKVIVFKMKRRKGYQKEEWT